MVQVNENSKEGSRTMKSTIRLCSIGVALAALILSVSSAQARTVYATSGFTTAGQESYWLKTELGVEQRSMNNSLWTIMLPVDSPGYVNGSLMARGVPGRNIFCLVISYDPPSLYYTDVTLTPDNVLRAYPFNLYFLSPGWNFIQCETPGGGSPFPEFDYVMY
jgi:hypothetical protein